MAGVFGYGTQLIKGAATLVCDLTNIGGLQLSADEIDVTTHCSADGYREFVQGLRDAGSFSIEGNFLTSDAGQMALLTSFNAGEVDTYRIVFPAELAAEWQFDAFVIGYGTEAPHDGVIPFSAELRATGKPDLNVTASADLVSLVASTGTFVPAFVGSTYDYVLNVSSGTASVTLTPTGAGVISVNGNVVASGAPSSAITLGAAGSVTTVYVTVQEAAAVTKFYTIKIARAA